MKMLKIGGLAAALVAAAGLGAAFVPVAHGQSSSGTRTRVAPRALEILGGRGGQIGVSIRDLDTSDAKATQGVVVEDVVNDSPAAAAGIKDGDVIVEFDGERVRSARQFSRLVSETPPGHKVSAVLMRNGQRVTVSVEPREGDGFRLFDAPGFRVFGDGRLWSVPAPPKPPTPPTPPTPPAPPAIPDFDTFVWRAGNTIGVTVMDLSPQLADYFGAKDGVLVTSVGEGTPAAKAGVKAGDVITSVNGSAVESTSELRRSVQRIESGADFTIDVLRDRKTVTLKGKLEEQRSRRTFRSIV